MGWIVGIAEIGGPRGQGRVLPVVVTASTGVAVFGSRLSSATGMLQALKKRYTALGCTAPRGAASRGALGGNSRRQHIECNYRKGDRGQDGEELGAHTRLLFCIYYKAWGLGLLAAAPQNARA